MEIRTCTTKSTKRYDWTLTNSYTCAMFLPLLYYGEDIRKQTEKEKKLKNPTKIPHNASITLH